jgi:predicted PurR-regulated permease PerM
MPFDIAQIFRTNKTLAIWAAFFGLVWLTSYYGLFGLVFITYILCFLFNGPIERLAAKTHWPRALWTTVVYLVFLAVVLTIISSVVPKLGAESSAFLKKLPETLETLRKHLDQWAWLAPDMAAPISKVKDYLALEALVGFKAETLFAVAVNSFNQISTYVSTFLLGTLFSFLIMLDFPKLRAKTIGLRDSRLRDIYDVTAGSVVRFAVVVGMGFRAQMMIAGVNTVLTALGLYVLGIQPVGLLSTVVFFCGLIPVLGTFISSAPIVLVAVNTVGPSHALWAIVMIILVHTIETYILNPRIVAAMFKISPLVTLMILYVGHKLFGLWGMVLGVPVSVFVFRYVILGLNLEVGGGAPRAPSPSASAQEGAAKEGGRG